MDLEDIDTFRDDVREGIGYEKLKKYLKDAGV